MKLPGCSQVSIDCTPGYQKSIQIGIGSNEVYPYRRRMILKNQKSERDRKVEAEKNARKRIRQVNLTESRERAAYCVSKVDDCVSTVTGAIERLRSGQFLTDNEKLAVLSQLKQGNTAFSLMMHYTMEMMGFKEDEITQIWQTMFLSNFDLDTSSDLIGELLEKRDKQQ